MTKEEEVKYQMQDEVVELWFCARRLGEMSKTIGLDTVFNEIDSWLNSDHLTEEEKKYNNVCEDVRSKYPEAFLILDYAGRFNKQNPNKTPTNH